MRASLTIRAQLLALVLAVVLPAVWLVAYTLHQWLDEARRSTERQLLALAQDTAARIEVVLQRHAELMARLAERPLVRALDAQRCDPAMADVLAVQPDFATLAVRGRDGQQLCASKAIARPDDSAVALPWFRDGLASGRFAVGGAYARPADGTWVTMLTQPVLNAAGEVGGLLILAVDLQAMQQQLLPALPADTVVVAFDRELRYIMRTIEPARWIGQPLPTPVRAQLPAKIDRLFALTGVDGVSRLNVGAEVPASGWHVYAAIPVDLVYAGYGALLWRSLAAGTTALALAGLLVWRIGRHIARPLDALAVGAAAVANGQVASVSRDGSREVVAVATELRRLASQREKLLGQYQRLRASHGNLANAARDIVLLVDQHGRIVEANAAALAAYGYSASELQAMTVTKLRAPLTRSQVESDRAEAARPEGALFETVHQRKDGSTLPVEVSVRQLRVDGQPYFQSFIRDISARKRDDALFQGQSAVLAKIAQGVPLGESLDALMCLVEAQAPGIVATILLLDDDGLHLRHGAAPSLPQHFVDAVDGVAIGPRAGSCGTAAYLRLAVVSQDIATDPLWDDWRALALAQGLSASWSTPIADAAGQVLGTFAMYFRRPARPEPAHQRLVDLVTHTASIAIVSALSAGRQRAQIAELLRWQAVMVDREERMQALKAETDALRARLGEPSQNTGGAAP